MYPGVPSSSQALGDPILLVDKWRKSVVDAARRRSAATHICPTRAVSMVEEVPWFVEA